VSAKILIVDDEIDTLNLMEMVLRMAGYKVVKALGGQECLRLAREERPDLIILDIMMPQLSGMEVLRALAKTYGSPPVILFSAKNQIPDVIEGMEAGAFRYLVKTASREQLLQAVRAALEQSRTQPGSEENWAPNW
jgi:DNA-binding response OmpR family regulator